MVYDEILLDLIAIDVEHRDTKDKGKGTVIREEYLCPCGKSTIPYIVYNFPEFKEGYSYDVCQSFSTNVYYWRFNEHHNSYAQCEQCSQL